MPSFNEILRQLTNANAVGPQRPPVVAPPVGSQQFLGPAAGLVPDFQLGRPGVGLPLPGTVLHPLPVVPAATPVPLGGVLRPEMSLLDVLGGGVNIATGTDATGTAADIIKALGGASRDLGTFVGGVAAGDAPELPPATVEAAQKVTDSGKFVGQEFTEKVAPSLPLLPEGLVDFATLARDRLFPDSAVTLGPGGVPLREGPGVVDGLKALLGLAPGALESSRGVVTDALFNLLGPEETPATTQALPPTPAPSGGRPALRDARGSGGGFKIQDILGPSAATGTPASTSAQELLDTIQPGDPMNTFLQALGQGVNTSAPIGDVLLKIGLNALAAKGASGADQEGFDTKKLLAGRKLGAEDASAQVAALKGRLALMEALAPKGISGNAFSQIDPRTGQHRVQASPGRSTTDVKPSNMLNILASQNPALYGQLGAAATEALKDDSSFLGLGASAQKAKLDAKMLEILQAQSPEAVAQLRSSIR